MRHCKECLVGILLFSFIFLTFPNTRMVTAKPIQPVKTQEATPFFEENFEGPFPPEGWEVIDNAGSGGVWDRSDYIGTINYCEYGSGLAAVAQPWDTNNRAWDTELRSPPIDLTNADLVKLEYASHFQDYAGNGQIWLDISIDGGANWINLRSQSADDPPGGTPAVGGTHETENLDSFTGNIIQLRWRFQASNSPAWMWHVDAIKIFVTGGYQNIQGLIVEPLKESFEDNFPPVGWQVIDNAGSGKVWERNDTAGVVNLCASGSGFAAVAHPWDINSSSWDTELWSPPIDLTPAYQAELTYASHFQDYAGNGEIWVDITTDDGANWVNLRNQTSDDPPGGAPMVGGTFEFEDLTPYIGNIIRLRWRFQARNSPAWMWHIDEITVKAFIPIPRLRQSDLNAPRILPPLKQVSFNYIITLNETTKSPGWEWDWEISMANSLPSGVTYQPGSLYCSDGQCWQENSDVHWEGQIANDSTIFLVFTAEMLSPACGESITSSAVINQSLLLEPVTINAKTGSWDAVWIDNPLNTFPPPGWSINDYGGSLMDGSVFTNTDPGDRGNQTGGKGSFIIVDDAAAGEGIAVETDLRLAPIDIPLYGNTFLVFQSDFEQQGGAGLAQVQLSNDMGANWDTIMQWDTDMPGPHTAAVDLSSYAGQTGVILRFYYHDGGTNAGWWSLDDIQVVGCYGQTFLPWVHTTEQYYKLQKTPNP